jgi:hypothetical protein
MRPMKNAHFAEKDDGNSTSFAFSDFRTEVDEERLDISPGHVAARGMRKHQLQRSLALSFHENIVPYFGTIHKNRAAGAAA